MVLFHDEILFNYLLINIYHSLSRRSTWQINIISNFPENKLLRRQFAWNAKARLLGNYKTNISKCRLLKIFTQHYERYLKKNVMVCTCYFRLKPIRSTECKPSILFGQKGKLLYILYRQTCPSKVRRPDQNCPESFISLCKVCLIIMTV